MDGQMGERVEGHIGEWMDTQSYTSETLQVWFQTTTVKQIYIIYLCMYLHIYVCMYLFILAAARS